MQPWLTLGMCEFPKTFLQVYECEFLPQGFAVKWSFKGFLGLTFGLSQTYT